MKSSPPSGVFIAHSPFGQMVAWLTRPRSVRSRSNEDLAAKVRSSFLTSDRTYGARRVWHDPIAEGVECGLHRIVRLGRTLSPHDN